MSGQHQNLKAFEGLTSGQKDSPETRDLREQGEKVNGMQCKRKRPEGKKEGGKEGCCEPTGLSQRSGLDLELQQA